MLRLSTRRREGRCVTAVAALLGLVLGLGAALAAGLVLAAPVDGVARVELLVYSGRPNPSFELTWDETDELVRRLDRLPPGAALPDAPGLGYGGLVVTLAGSGGQPHRVIAYRGVRVESSDSVDDRLDIEGVEGWLLGIARRQGYADLLASLGL